MGTRSEAPRVTAMRSKLLALLLLTTCLPHDAARAAEPYVTRPGAGIEQHHLMAWVPMREAATAGVAQALVHLHLDQALRAAEAEHCQGTWQLSTPTQQRITPQRVNAPPELGAQPSWYYRISRSEMSLDGCPGVDTLTFQRTVSRHLPEWMLVRPANRYSLWQQGRLLMLDSRNDTAYALAQSR